MALKSANEQFFTPMDHACQPEFEDSYRIYAKEAITVDDWLSNGINRSRLKVAISNIF